MDAVNPNVSTRNALDFQGLGELRGQAARDGQSALRETAQQFEALFLQMMLKSMRDSIEKSDLMASDHSDTFEGMFDREVAHAMAKRNALGLADMLVDVHKRQMSAMVPAAEALAMRENKPAQKGLPLNPPQAGLPLGAPPAKLQALPRPDAPMPLSRMDKTLGRGTP
jgi:flagellar protein FlgJ